MPRQRPARTWWGLLLAFWVVSGAGCSAYVLQGRVIEGVSSEMTFVGADDPRLWDTTVGNVRITVHRDPDRLSRRLVATDVSDARGRFVISLQEFGAGWMQEQWLIRASKTGFQTAVSMPRLNQGMKDMRLLIILAPGASQDPREEDLIEESRRYR